MTPLGLPEVFHIARVAETRVLSSLFSAELFDKAFELLPPKFLGFSGYKFPKVTVMIPKRVIPCAKWCMCTEAAMRAHCARALET
jgi:hypothetical protein